MSNEIATELRAIADRLESEMPDARVLAIVVGDSDGVKLTGYYGNIGPEEDIAIFMFEQGIERMKAKKKEIMQ